MSERSGRPRDFLTSDESAEVVRAIGEAERRTSGEIRVHLEHRCKGGDPYARARRVFEELGMTATAERNGVLVYLATADRRFAVLGDAGIHERVGADFWDDVVALMERRFRADAFGEGLRDGIARIGEKLAEHFPYAGDDRDENELPDDISVAEEERD